MHEGIGGPVSWGTQVSFFCILDMLLHGQAHKMALEGAIVPGSIVFTA
jgi:hypothetical protein